MSVPDCRKNLRRSILSTVSLNYRLHTTATAACDLESSLRLFTLSKPAIVPDWPLKWIPFRAAWTDRSPTPDCVLQTKPGTKTARLPEAAAGSASCNTHPGRHRSGNRRNPIPDVSPPRRAPHSSASAVAAEEIAGAG